MSDDGRACMSHGLRALSGSGATICLSIFGKPSVRRAKGLVIGSAAQRSKLGFALEPRFLAPFGPRYTEIQGTMADPMKEEEHSSQ